MQAALDVRERPLGEVTPPETKVFLAPRLYNPAPLREELWHFVSLLG